MYVADTFVTMKSVPADFLSSLNSCHPSINFTVELPPDNKLPFVGFEVLKKRCIKLETSVYRKPTNTGLLLHHQSKLQEIATEDRVISCVPPVVQMGVFQI